MIFGTDMWKALKFLIALIKLIIEIFGDNDDKEIAKENHVDL